MRRRVGMKIRSKIRSFSSLMIATVAGTLLCGQAEAQVTAEQGYPSQITLKWDENEQADGYRVCRKEKDKEWCILADLTNATQYTDISAEEGTSYIYSVRPFKVDDRQVYWMTDDVVKNVCVFPPEPKDIRMTPGENGGDAELTWKLGGDDIENNLLYSVSFFEVYTKQAEDATWKFLSSTESQPNKKATKLLLEDVDENSWYTVRSAYRTAGGETIYSTYDEVGIQGGSLTAATARIYHAASSGTKGNEIAWVSLSDKATKLEVLRKDSADDTFHRIKMITDPEEIQKGSYTDTDITITNTYWYTVRAYLEQSQKQVSGWYEPDGVMVQALPNMPTMLTASYLTSNTPCIQVGWDANENTAESCDGYYIYRRDSKDSEWILLGTNTDANSTLFMDAAIESGATYEYQVQAYKESESGEFVESESMDIVHATVPKQ